MSRNISRQERNHTNPKKWVTGFGSWSGSVDLLIQAVDRVQECSSVN